MELRSFRAEDLPELLALQNRLAPPRRRMSEALLRDSLTDGARGRGAQVRIVADGAGRAAGFAPTCGVGSCVRS